MSIYLWPHGVNALNFWPYLRTPEFHFMNHNRGILGKRIRVTSEWSDLLGRELLRGNPFPSKSTWEDVKMEKKKCLLSKKRESEDEE